MESSIGRLGRVLKFFSRVGSLSLVLFFFAISAPHAQQICDPNNPDNGACQQAQRPDCFHCALVNNVATCVPNDTFCVNISGGNTPNECRSAVCQATPNPVAGNPTGCDFEYSNTDQSDDNSCVNCQPNLNNVNCGNGICEPGETVANCSIDCLVPGFTGPNDQATLNLACQIPGITFIHFAGPPWNVPDSLTCEDGDICTTNTCSNGTCNVAPAQCNPISDLCCPSGCTPPANGATTCPVGAAGTTCDPDCLPPQQCEASPTPIPIPSPIVPPFTGILEGDGIIGHCSLYTGPVTGSEKLPWVLGFGLCFVATLVLRKRLHKD